MTISAFFLSRSRGFSLNRRFQLHGGRPFSSNVELHYSQAATQHRPTARSEILDAKLIEAKRDLVERHYQDRGLDQSVSALLDSISELNKERIEYINQGNSARSKRKAISSQIGSLLKAGQSSTTEITALKDEVTNLTQHGDFCADRVNDLDTRIGSKLRSLPNLLDDR